MKPFDYASRIIPIDLVGGHFVVSLAGSRWKWTLAMGPSSQRADHVALINRLTVAEAIAQGMEEALCWAAAEIDDGYLRRRILYASEAAILCRKLAEEFRVGELKT
jgi:hypothetical protein